ncbi:hypothetical protein Pla175_25610 [Pirellulimonas nuda]|uniref:Uncharacterized protein n=1 Tax=Pirellulimonas nuda TaxID=2528009 RepID=A0A518DCG8_9BACT|nr:hypothetical protein [Pirellulimonas nuda]QDU89174.1 hypothetical protein Pla175_25610 [Pirellulimonas nuda]
MTPQSLPQRRSGVSSIETIVACSLLTATMSLMAPMLVRNSRLIDDCRDYRTGLDELANQLDRLEGLPVAQLESAMQSLAPSEFAASRLPDCKLTGEVHSDGVLWRITVQLAWPTRFGPRSPLTLCGWSTGAAAAPLEVIE